MVLIRRITIVSGVGILPILSFSCSRCRSILKYYRQLSSFVISDDYLKSLPAESFDDDLIYLNFDSEYLLSVTTEAAVIVASVVPSDSAHIG